MFTLMVHCLRSIVHFWFVLPTQKRQFLVIIYVTYGNGYNPPISSNIFGGSGKIWVLKGGDVRIGSECCSAFVSFGSLSKNFLEEKV